MAIQKFQNPSGRLRIQFSPEQITQFERNVVPGTNTNSNVTINQSKKSAQQAQQRSRRASKQRMDDARWNAHQQRTKMTAEEKANEYTQRQIAEATKPTWRTTVADGLHMLGEAAMASTPITATSYFGAKGLNNIYQGTTNGNIDQTLGGVADLGFAFMPWMKPLRAASVTTTTNQLQQMQNWAEGYYRPYWDQMRNGYQGWKDARLAQQNGTILTRHNKSLFANLGSKATETGKFDGISTSNNGKYMGVDFIMPNGSEHVGVNNYFAFNTDDLFSRWGVTQDAPNYNTYNFHIGGNRRIGRIVTTEDLMKMARTTESLPAHSYVTDYSYPTTGQAGMNFAAPHYKTSLERGVPTQIIEGKAPSLIESIKMSKMNNPGTIPMEDMTSPIVVNGKILPETPLATGSYKTLLARPVKVPNHWQLRYQNGYMPYFNSQSELPKWEVLDPNHFLTLPVEQQKTLVNDFIQTINPKARTAFIGRDGQLKIPIIANFKTK